MCSVTIKPLYPMHDRINAGLLIFPLCALFSFSLLPLRPPIFGFYVLSPDFPGTVKRRSTPLAHAVCMAAARIFPRPKKAALGEGDGEIREFLPPFPLPRPSIPLGIFLAYWPSSSSVRSASFLLPPSVLLLYPCRAPLCFPPCQNFLSPSSSPHPIPPLPLFPYVQLRL